MNETLTTDNAQHQRYLAIGPGYWGSGDSMVEAQKQLAKAGYRKKTNIRYILFLSDLPFAPAEREAKDNEADCWMDSTGCISWIRCERIILA